MRKWQPVLAFVMIAIIVVNVSFWITFGSTNGQDKYDLGYQQGKTDEHSLAFQEGVLNGNSSGYTAGFEVGKKLGLAIGNETGFTSGSSSGYSVGYKTGEATGSQTGYTSGYAVGTQAGTQAGDSAGFIRGNSTGYQFGFQIGYSNGSSVGYVEGLKDGAGTGYNIRDPAYQEMTNFIAIDKTNQNQFINDSYVCWNFASDFINNAFKASYRCGFVYLGLADGAHAIVCFNTTDRGLFFVEPQDDNILPSLTVGQPYWNRNIYQTPSYNDTVVTFSIVW